MINMILLPRTRTKLHLKQDAPIRNMQKIRLSKYGIYVTTVTVYESNNNYDEDNNCYNEDDR